MTHDPGTGRQDVVVVGLGALGSFALLALGRRGVRALGLDRHDPPHVLGSSHGRSRIIREAYFEHPLYVPLVRQAYEGWERLEEETGSTLFRRTGALMLGPPEGEVIAGTMASVREHGIPHRALSGPEVRRTFPRIQPPQGAVGVLEERAGILRPEEGIRAALRRAGDLGAQIRPGVQVLGWEVEEHGVRVRTSAGEVRTRRLLLAPGPWMGELAGLSAELEVERQVTLWFEAGVKAPDGPEEFPVALWEYEPGRYIYLVPDQGDGLKAALHHEGEIVDPETVSREVTPRDEERVRTLLDRLLPGVAGSVRETSVCLYTNTPDGHFLLGPHPSHPEVLLLGGGSGHAFKFAPALGERAADLLLGSQEPSPADPFSPIRLLQE